MVGICTKFATASSRFTDMSSKSDAAMPPLPPMTGLQRWHKKRSLWTESTNHTDDLHHHSSDENEEDDVSTKTCRMPLLQFDYDQVIDDIVNNRKFDGAIPLPLLVDTLVDLWEADGLFE